MDIKTLYAIRNSSGYSDGESWGCGSRRGFGFGDGDGDGDGDGYGYGDGDGEGEE